MFTEWTNSHSIRNALIPAASLHPFPQITDRNSWDSLPSSLRDVWIQKAESYLHFSYPSLTASAFMDYVRTGNRQIYEVPYYDRRYALTALIIGECMEDQGRFLDDIINGIWAICEESFWGISAHNGLRHNSGQLLPDTENHIIDLFAAETAGLLTHCVYLLKERLDEITPQICRRIDRELESRIRLPFLNREDFWWMGFGKVDVNNWDPWIISNLLSVFLYTEQDTYRREQAIYKMFECLDHFMDQYGADGGCDEGTSYWNYAGGTLFDCVDQLYRASDGKINFFNEESIRQIGRFLYRSFIHNRYFINFADGSAKVSIAREMVWRYGKRINDPLLKSLGACSPISNDPPDIPKALRRILPDLFCQDEFSRENGTSPYLRDMYMESIQVMAARKQEGSFHGFYLAAKGGHNGESHNHNDIGSCIIYYDGIPVLIDVGVETYTKQTFSEERYSIWTMQSQYHNLPTINGFQQLPGKDYSAQNVSYSCSDKQVRFSLDIGHTYPKEAGIFTYCRTYTYQRPSSHPSNMGQHKTYTSDLSSIIIQDHASFSKNENQITLNFISWKKPQKLPGGFLSIPLEETGSILLSYSTERFQVTIEPCPITDQKLLPVWGNQIYRIQFNATVNTSFQCQIKLTHSNSRL